MQNYSDLRLFYQLTSSPFAPLSLHFSATGIASGMKVLRVFFKQRNSTQTNPQVSILVSVTGHWFGCLWVKPIEIQAIRARLTLRVNTYSNSSLDCPSWRRNLAKNLQRFPHFWSFEHLFDFSGGKRLTHQGVFSPCISSDIVGMKIGAQLLNFEVKVCLPGCFCFCCLEFEVISERGEDLFSSVHISLVLSIWRDITRVVVC